MAQVAVIIGLKHSEFFLVLEYLIYDSIKFICQVFKPKFKNRV